MLQEHGDFIFKWHIWNPRCPGTNLMQQAIVKLTDEASPVAFAPFKHPPCIHLPFIPHSCRSFPGTGNALHGSPCVTVCIQRIPLDWQSCYAKQQQLQVLANLMVHLWILLLYLSPCVGPERVTNQHVKMAKYESSPFQLKARRCMCLPSPFLHQVVSSSNLIS